jgi:hypothetical protein
MVAVVRVVDVVTVVGLGRVVVSGGRGVGMAVAVVRVVDVVKVVGLGRVVVNGGQPLSLRPPLS